MTLSPSIIRVVSTLISIFVIFSSSRALACYCDDTKKAPDSFDSAVDAASLIFVGTAERLTWKGEAKEKQFTLPGGKTVSASQWIDPNATEEEFTPSENSSISGYDAYFSVQRLIKDTDNRAEREPVKVRVTQNGGWCGFQFAKGKTYLVYARDGGNPHIVPMASKCSRTQALESAKEDLEKM